MVDVDPSWIIPLIVTTAVSLGIVALHKFNRTSEGTLTGTIKLEGMQTNLEEVKEEMNRGFDKMEKLITKSDERTSSQFREVWAKLDDISARQLLHQYRLDDMDKRTQHQKGVS